MIDQEWERWKTTFQKGERHMPDVVMRVIRRARKESGDSARRTGRRIRHPGRDGVRPCAMPARPRKSRISSWACWGP